MEESALVQIMKGTSKAKDKDRDKGQVEKLVKVKTSSGWCT